jgi:hypothetical protein
MGHEDNREAFLCVDSLENSTEIQLMKEIEVSRRLIKKQHTRLLGQRASQQHALPFSGGQRAHLTLAR